MFLCQCYAVFIAMALYYNLTSGTLILTALLFLLRIAFAICGLMCFQMNFRVDISVCVMNVIGISM
jgi:hypothetical protein